MIIAVGHAGRSKELASIGDLPSRLTGTVIIDSANHSNLRQLAERYQLDYGNLCDALDANEAPRLEHRDNFDYLYLRLPIPHDNANLHNTYPILIAYSRHALLIISGGKLLSSLNDQNFIHDLSITPTTTSALLYTLARIVASYDSHIKAQTDAIHSVVTKLQNHKLANEDFINFVVIEDQINSFTSALTPLVPLFNRLQGDKNLNLSTDDSDLVTDIILATQQSINVCDANSKRIASIRDAYTTLSNSSLNLIMKTLTVATLLIAAPNLVFSMYGMNIRLPMQYTDISFIAVIILAIAITILVVIWAKRRHLF